MYRFTFSLVESEVQKNTANCVSWFENEATQLIKCVLEGHFKWLRNLDPFSDYRIAGADVSEWRKELEVIAGNYREKKIQQYLNKKGNRITKAARNVLEERITQILFKDNFYLKMSRTIELFFTAEQKGSSILFLAE